MGACCIPICLDKVRSGQSRPAEVNHAEKQIVLLDRRGFAVMICSDRANPEEGETKCG
jgi:hypothetical protein